MEKKKLNPEQGKRLKECLEDMRVSQKELAEKTGYTKQYISNIVVGKKNMSLESAERIAKVLGVRKEYLLCRDNFKTGEHEIVSIFKSLENVEKIFERLLKELCRIDIIGTIVKTEEGKEFYFAAPVPVITSEKAVTGRKVELEGELCTPKTIELVVELNGIQKNIPLDMMYYLGKDIMEYIQFKGEQFKKEVFPL